MSVINKDLPVALSTVRRAGTYEVLQEAGYVFAWNTTFGQPLTVGILFLASQPSYFATENPGDPVVSFQSFTEAQLLATYNITLAWSSVARVTWDWSGGSETQQIALGNRKLPNPDNPLVVGSNPTRPTKQISVHTDHIGNGLYRGHG